MDLTNRALIVGMALLGIFVVLVIILLAWGAPDESIERLGDLTGYLDVHNTTGAKLIITFAGLILVLLATVVIISEAAPPESGSLRVGKVEAGEARIATDEIVRRLEEELRLLPQIQQVQANVLARGQKAEVNLDLHVMADADLAGTTEQACQRARQLIEERMGLALTRPPQAQLHYRELRVARPQEGPPPAASEPPAAGLPPAQEAPRGQAVGPPFGTEPAHEASERSQEDRPAGA